MGVVLDYFLSVTPRPANRGELSAAPVTGTSGTCTATLMLDFYDNPQIKVDYTREEPVDPQDPEGPTHQVTSSWLIGSFREVFGIMDQVKIEHVNDVVRAFSQAFADAELPPG